MPRNLLYMIVVVLMFAAPVCAMDIFQAIWQDEVDSLTTLINADPKAKFLKERDEAGRYPLHVAVVADNERMFDMLLARGGDINMVDKNGLTPLLYAVVTENLSFVKHLLELGANVAIVTPHGDSGIHLAAARNNTAIIENLAAYHGDLNAANETGQRPLHIAVTIGQPNLIHFLIDRGADPNQGDRDGITPLHLAVMQGSPAMVTLLLDRGAAVNLQTASSFDIPAGREGTPIHLAILFDRSRTLKTLFDYSPNTRIQNKAGYTPLMVAIDEGNMDMVDQLLRARADVENKEGFPTPMDQALELGSFELVDRLIQYGYPVNRPNPKGRPPLNEAIHREYVDIVELLLDNGAEVEGTETSEYPMDVAMDVRNLAIIDHLILAGVFLEAQNERGNTPLRTAVNNEDIPLVRLLCNRDANVNEFTEQGELTLLQTAIKKGNIEITRMLIESGAETECGETLEDSPIFMAMDEGYMFLALTLDAYDADVNRRDVEGNTYLHYAAQMSDVRMIGLLMDAGADVDATNDMEETPLHRAAQKGNEEAVEMLLAYGADINAEDAAGQTPLDVARGHAQELLFLYNARNGNAEE